MPWLLDSAFSPGDLDSGKSYTHLKIAHLEHSIREGFLRVHVERGYITGGAWVSAPDSLGQLPPMMVKDEPAAEPAGTDYADLMATVVAVGEEGEAIYDLAAAAIYTFLASKGWIAAGSVVS